MLKQVRALCARLENPYWMAKPDDWVWVRPDGAAAGFGLIARSHPGMANLLWLAMDLATPPWEYDMDSNPMMQLLFVYGTSSRLCGQPLADLAALSTLQEFHELLGAVGPGSNPLEHAYPVLRMFAARRLRHA